jgi:hypothetical protein
VLSAPQAHPHNQLLSDFAVKEKLEDKERDSTGVEIALQAKDSTSVTQKHPRGIIVGRTLDRARAMMSHVLM